MMKGQEEVFLGSLDYQFTLGILVYMLAVLLAFLVPLAFASSSLLVCSGLLFYR